MIEFQNYHRAVIITGDRDFHCSVKHLISKNKLAALLTPNQQKFSALFKQDDIKPFLRYVSDLKYKLEHKKRPHEDKTL